MNKIAWSILFEKQIDFVIEDLFFVETSNSDWTFNYFLYWKTYINTSLEMISKLEKMAWIKSINYDISISTEDSLEIYQEIKIDWIYTITSIEWAAENFDSVVSKFSDSSPYIISIREAESSNKFWNRIIKIDIVN